MSDSTTDILAQVGKALPNRLRVSGNRIQSIKLVPTGEIAVQTVVDSFTEQHSQATKDETTDKLQDKQIVLIFGRSSHFLTQSFLIPKMALIYHHLTLKPNKPVEFLYVSLPDESQQGHERVVQSMRK